MPDIANFLGVAKLADFQNEVASSFEGLKEKLPDGYDASTYFDIEGDTSAKEGDEFDAEIKATLRDIISAAKEELIGVDGNDEEAKNKLRFALRIANDASASAHWRFGFQIGPETSSSGDSLKHVKARLSTRAKQPPKACEQKKSNSRGMANPND